MRKLTEAKGWAPNLIGLVVLYEEENALRLYVHSAGRWLSASREESLPRSWPCRHPELRLQPPERNKTNSCCFSCPVYGTLLWQPRKMNTSVNWDFSDFFSHTTFTFWVWGNQTTEVKCHFHNILSRVHTITLTSLVVLTVTTWMRQCLSGRFSTLKSSFSR